MIPCTRMKDWLHSMKVKEKIRDVAVTREKKPKLQNYSTCTWNWSANSFVLESAYVKLFHIKNGLIAEISSIFFCVPMLRSCKGLWCHMWLSPELARVPLQAYRLQGSGLWAGALEYFLVSVCLPAVTSVIFISWCRVIKYMAYTVNV